MLIKIFLKSFVRHPVTVKVLSFFIACYMRFVFKTTRWQIINQDVVLPYWNTHTPVIGCFWHNRLALMTFIWRSSNPFYMMISNHLDGQIIADTIGHCGIKTIIVSSKNSINGIRNAVKLIRQGNSLGITPDGPRGPRFVVDQGAVRIAQITHADLIPASYSVTRRWVLNSWDRLVIPLPFGRGVFIWGKPICYAALKKKQSPEKIHKALESSLNEISNKADALCGHSPIPLRQAYERPIKNKKRH